MARRKQQGINARAWFYGSSFNSSAYQAQRSATPEEIAQKIASAREAKVKAIVGLLNRFHFTRPEVEMFGENEWATVAKCAQVIVPHEESRRMILDRLPSEEPRVIEWPTHQVMDGETVLARGTEANCLIYLERIKILGLYSDARVEPITKESVQ